MSKLNIVISAILKFKMAMRHNQSTSQLDRAVLARQLRALADSIERNDI